MRKMPFRATRTRFAGVALAATVILIPALTLAAANVQRLAANGLSATDPQIVVKLRALFTARGRKPVAGPQPVVSLLTTTPRLQPLRGGLPFPLTGNRPAAGSATPTPAPQSTAPALLAVASAYFRAAGSEGLDVQGVNLGSNPTLKLTTANCGNTQPALYANDPGDLFYKLGYNVPATEPASLTLSTPAYSLNSGAFSLDPSLNDQVSVSLPIGDVAPFFAGDALNEAASTYATTVSSHASTNPADPTATGTDTLGYGVSLTNGWQVTAQIGNIHSYMDSPAEPPVSDAFRSASIVQQPSAGRLETKVAWSFEGGESISYTITWTFVHGAFGARMTTSQPKQTPCSDEQ